LLLLLVSGSRELLLRVLRRQGSKRSFYAVTVQTAKAETAELNLHAGCSAVERGRKDDALSVRVLEPVGGARIGALSVGGGGV
jgi:hypothetical protein